MTDLDQLILSVGLKVPLEMESFIVDEALLDMTVAEITLLILG